jgi:hypothetical protein
MKTHQSRVVRTVTVAQQIPAGLRLAQFAVEAQPRGDFLSRGLMAVGGISQVIGCVANHFREHRVLAISGQQHRALRVLSLLIKRICWGHGAAFPGKLAKSVPSFGFTRLRHG